MINGCNWEHVAAIATLGAIGCLEVIKGTPDPLLLTIAVGAIAGLAGFTIGKGNA